MNLRHYHFGVCCEKFGGVVLKAIDQWRMNAEAGNAEPVVAREWMLQPFLLTVFLSEIGRRNFHRCPARILFYGDLLHSNLRDR